MLNELELRLNECSTNQLYFDKKKYIKDKRYKKGLGIYQNKV